MKQTFNKLLWLIIISLTSTPCFADKNDKNQPISVNADRSEFDERKGIQILEGNVEIDQGSLSIRAAKITLYMKKNQLSKIVGQGQPITIHQVDNQGEAVNASSKKFTYDVPKSHLILIGNAVLEQPRQSLKGARIEYNTATQSIIADGGGKGRVNIVIQPATQP